MTLTSQDFGVIPREQNTAILVLDKLGMKDSSPRNQCDIKDTT